MAIEGIAFVAVVFVLGMTAALLERRFTTAANKQEEVRRERHFNEELEDLRRDTGDSGIVDPRTKVRTDPNK